MSTIKQFKDLNIEAIVVNEFIGDKIDMKRIINRPIIVHKAKIQPSNYDGLRLAMQIELNNEMRVAWNASKFLMNAIEQMKDDDFPFATTIVNENDCYKFT